jgi:hypothetical protein
MSKNKWVPVYDGDGKHLCTVNAAGEMKGLGPANDRNTTRLHHYSARREKFAETMADHEAAVDALLAEIPHDPPPPEWQAKVHAECDKIDAELYEWMDAAQRADIDRLSRGESDLDAIDQSEPTPAPEAQLHDVHTDDETTHVGAVVVDALFDQTESE